MSTAVLNDPLLNVSYAAHSTNDEGTRFLSKPSGSQYTGSGGSYLRSCFGCGLHKAAKGGQFRKLAGRSQFICSDDCAGRLGLKPKASAAH